MLTDRLMEMPNNKSTDVSPKLSRYPSCIVWTPIPMLTYVLVDYA